MTTLSRRTLLKSSIWFGASLVKLPSFFTQSGSDDSKPIFDLLATTEAFNCTHYYLTLTDSGVELTPKERASVVAMLDADLTHLELLQSLGGQSMATDFYMPVNVYRNRESFLPVTEDVKTATSAAYVAANFYFSNVGKAALGTTMGQIAAVEAVHLALTRQLADKLPDDVALAPALYDDPLKVESVFQPFIKGGDGFAGPNSFPGADDIRKLIGDAALRKVAPFTEMQK